jgi:hypothetical protein
MALPKIQLIELIQQLDGDIVGVDEGGLNLVTEKGAFIELGGMPETEDEAPVPVCADGGGCTPGTPRV